VRIRGLQRLLEESHDGLHRLVLRLEIIIRSRVGARGLLKKDNGVSSLAASALQYGEKHEKSLIFEIVARSVADESLAPPCKAASDVKQRIHASASAVSAKNRQHSRVLPVRSLEDSPTFSPATASSSFWASEPSEVVNDRYYG
jgi:hypothetical protein